MYDLEKEKQIISILRNKQFDNIANLANALYVSESTLRRMLVKMEQKGIITRTYGGVYLKSESETEHLSVELREKQNLVEKKALVKKAIEFIEDDTAIFIDSSTTCLQIAPLLNDFKNLTIITNGLNLAYELMLKTQHKIMVVGGNIQFHTNSIVGSLAEKMMSDVHVSLAIFSTSEMDAEFGFSEKSAEQASFKNLMVHNAARSLYLVDDSKIDHKSLFKTCDLKDVSIIVTKKSLDKRYFQAAPKTLFVHCD